MKSIFGEKFEAEIYQAVKASVEAVGLDTIKAGPFFGIQAKPVRDDFTKKAA